MATINEPVFVDGTFDAGNIIYGRTDAPSGAADTTRSIAVSFSSFGKPTLAGSGEVVVVVTGYSAIPGNRTLNTGFINATVNTVSPTGFTLHVHRMDTSSTWVYWMAMRLP